MNERDIIKSVEGVLSQLKKEEYGDYLKYINNYTVIKKRKEETKRKKEEKINTIKRDIQSFIQEYNRNHPYFYIPECNIFIKYDHNNYSIIDRNMIWYNLLNQLNRYPVLLKHKDNIKKVFYDSIKNNILTSATPESETIQDILVFFQQFITKDKDSAKYLLTILGDCILKKKLHKVFITSNDITYLLRFIEDTIQELLYGKQNLKNKFISQYFKSKYHNHNYKDIRLLNTVEIHTHTILLELCKKFIDKNIYNIIVVSCHYSYRYSNSENFIQSYCNNNEVRDYTLYVNEKTKSSIVDDFLTKYIQKNTNMNIQDKEMYYLFHYYLKELHLPRLMFNGEFVEEVAKHVEYTNGLWLGVTSKYLDHIHYFINDFFSKHFDTQQTSDYLSSYEISEIYQIFNSWKKQEKKSISFSYKEDTILNIINHFYPNIEIRNNRLLYGVYSSLWDKKKDLQEYMTQTENLDYEEYLVWARRQKLPYVVSKEFFDTYFSK